MEKRFILIFLIMVFMQFSYLITGQVDTSQCPTGLPRNKYLLSYKNICVRFGTEHKDWNGARGDCRNGGGDLVEVLDAETQTFLVNTLKQLNWENNGVWIGATDIQKEGTWLWVSGQPVTYGRWQKGYGPQHTGFFSTKYTDDCAQIRLDHKGHWQDKPCAGGIAYHYTYICQYDKIPTTTSTTTTVTSTRSTTYITTPNATMPANVANQTLSTAKYSPSDTYKTTKINDAISYTATIGKFVSTVPKRPTSTMVELAPSSTESTAANSTTEPTSSSSKTGPSSEREYTNTTTTIIKPTSMESLTPEPSSSTSKTRPSSPREPTKTPTTMVKPASSSTTKSKAVTSTPKATTFTSTSRHSPPRENTQTTSTMVKPASSTLENKAATSTPKPTSSTSKTRPSSPRKPTNISTTMVNTASSSTEFKAVTSTPKPKSSTSKTRHSSPREATKTPTTMVKPALASSEFKDGTTTPQPTPSTSKTRHSSPREPTKTSTTMVKPASLSTESKAAISTPKRISSTSKTRHSSPREPTKTTTTMIKPASSSTESKTAHSTPKPTSTSKTIPSSPREPTKIPTTVVISALSSVESKTATSTPQPTLSTSKTRPSSPRNHTNPTTSIVKPTSASDASLTVVPSSNSNSESTTSPRGQTTAKHTTVKTDKTTEPTEVVASRYNTVIVGKPETTNGTNVPVTSLRMIESETTVPSVKIITTATISRATSTILAPSITTSEHTTSEHKFNEYKMTQLLQGNGSIANTLSSLYTNTTMTRTNPTSASINYTNTSEVTEIPTTIINKHSMDKCPKELPRNKYLKTYKKICLRFVNEEKKWYEALDDCRDSGGDLIEILDDDTQTFVVNTLKTLNWTHDGVWIGATDMENEGTWLWVSGRSERYENWQHGYGSKHTGLFSYRYLDDCAQIRLDHVGQWQDKPCTGGLALPYSYICQYGQDTSQCPPSLSRNQYLIAFNDVCLRFINEERDWNDARDDCRDGGGDLIQVLDDETQRVVVYTLGRLKWNHNGVWIGATDIQNEGTWLWVSGEPVTYGKWQKGYGPQHTGFFSTKYIDDCAQIRLDNKGHWQDKPCYGGVPYSYVCQYDKVSIGNDTVTAEVATRSMTPAIKVIFESTSTVLNSTTVVNQMQSFAVILIVLRMYLSILALLYQKGYYMVQRPSSIRL